MFNKIPTTKCVEYFVQARVDLWKAGSISGRDLTASITEVIESDCDARGKIDMEIIKNKSHFVKK